MKYSKGAYRRISHIFAASVLALFALQVTAGEFDRSGEGFNQTMQIWRMHQVAELQQALDMEVRFDYAAQVADQDSGSVDQTAAVKHIEAAQPDIMSKPIEAVELCEPGKTRC